MRTVTLHITDKQYPFFIELAHNLDFVKKIEVAEDPGKEQILQGIREAVEEIKLIKAGKKKSIPLSEFLNEL